MCGMSFSRQKGNFFMSKASPLFASNESFSCICTQCANKMFAECIRQYSDKKLALMIMCHYLDAYFSEPLYEDIKDTEFALGKYLAKLNGVQYKGKSFVSYMTDSMKHNTVSLPTTSTVYEPKRDAKWSESELESRDIVIETVGYDPYYNYGDEDRRFLYCDLVRYFDDDAADDPYKLSQLIQIVNNNNQIRKFDLAIAQLQATGTGVRTEECKNLTEIKARLIASNDKIAKENEISVKNRSNKELGKSTLGYLQRDLRRKGFERAEENYYDQLTSPGTMWAIDMSHKSVIENALFDENDKKQMFEIQRKMIQDLQSQVDDMREKNRLLNKENARLKKSQGDFNA